MNLAYLSQLVAVMFMSNSPLILAKMSLVSGNVSDDGGKYCLRKFRYQLHIYMVRCPIKN